MKFLQSVHEIALLVKTNINKFSAIRTIYMNFTAVLEAYFQGLASVFDPWMIEPRNKLTIMKKIKEVHSQQKNLYVLFSNAGFSDEIPKLHLKY